MRFFKDPTGLCGGLYAALEDDRVNYWFQDARRWQGWLQLGSKAEEIVKKCHPQEVCALEVLVVCGAWDGSKK
jgi:hypothetical protein